MATGTVLVTGATGFVAGHCIRELLEHGYQVRGSVRSLARSDVTHLRALERGEEIDFVEARLDSDLGWPEAVAGCDHVLHVASPIPFRIPRNEDEVIRPAVDGTRRVLEAAAEAGVRRVVMTSSIDTVTHDRAKGDRPRTEEDWSLPEESAPYGKSKVLAERAAWEIAGATGLELVTLLPGAVIGPPQQLRRESSGDMVRRVLAGEMPVCPPLELAYTDVRDLATAHRLALETPAAAGNRYLCAGEVLSLTDIARLLAEEYGPRGYRISTRRLPVWALRAAAVVSPEARLATIVLGSPQRVSVAKIERDLGWTPRPVRDTVLQTAEDLIARGIVTPAGRGRRG